MDCTSSWHGSLIALRHDDRATGPKGVLALRAHYERWYLWPIVSRLPRRHRSPCEYDSPDSIDLRRTPPRRTFANRTCAMAGGDRRTRHEPLRPDAEWLTEYRSIWW